MKPLLLWLMSPEWGQIVHALLHSLWQAGAVALLLGLALHRLVSPAWRYRLALGSLGATLLAVLFTWSVLNQRADQQSDPQRDFRPDTDTTSLTDRQPGESNGTLVVTVVGTRHVNPSVAQASWTAWLALVWLLGGMLMLLRARIQVAGAERLRRSGRPLEDARITQLLAEAQRAVGFARNVRMTVTDALTSPAVVGVLMPTLILPLSLMTTLTQGQLRFVLLHELAHIQRGDYFANLFQLFMEALLFFNPAVWWISHQVRREREACCDALAIELSGAPVEYARTLVQVAESGLNPSPAAAAAFGNKQREPSSLSDRVQRLLVPGYRPALRLTWRAMVMSLVVSGTLLMLSALGTRNTVGAILAGETLKESREAVLPANQNSTGLLSTAIPSSSETNALVVGRNQADLIGKRTAYELANNGRATIIKKLGQIHLDQVHFENTPLSDVIKLLAQEARKCDPEGRGINFIFNSGTVPGQIMDQPPSDRRRILDDELAAREGERANLRNRFRDEHPRVTQINLEISRLTRLKASLEPILITLTPPLTNASLADTIAVIVAGASKQISCSIESFGVLFAPVTSSDNLTTRRIKVNPTAFSGWLDYPNLLDSPAVRERGTGVPRFTVSQLPDSSLDHTKHPLHKLFTAAGIDMQPPKTFFYKDRIGEIYIRATQEEIERLTRVLADQGHQSEPVGATTSAPAKPLHDDWEAARSPFNVQAGSMNFDAATRILTASDGVVIKHGETVITADSARINEEAGEAVVEGKVKVQSPLGVVSGDKVTFDSKSGQVRAENVSVSSAGKVASETVKAAIQPGNQSAQAPAEVPVKTKSAAQINIKAQFVEITQPENQALGFDWYLGNLLLSNSAATNWSVPYATLTSEQHAVVLRALEQRNGVDVLTQPQVITSSGQQARIQIEEIRTIVTGIDPLALALPGITATNKDGEPAFYTTETRAFGQSLDVLATLQADGKTINLTATPKFSEFLGYDAPPTNATVYVNGRKWGKATAPLPRIRVEEATTTASVLDGQTLMLLGTTATDSVLMKDKVPVLGDIPLLGKLFRSETQSTKSRMLIVFITPTLMDASGNPVHQK